MSIASVLDRATGRALNIAIIIYHKRTIPTIALPDKRFYLFCGLIEVNRVVFVVTFVVTFVVIFVVIRHFSLFPLLFYIHIPGDFLE